MDTKEKLNIKLWAEEVNARMVQFKGTDNISSNIERMNRIFQETKKQSTYRVWHGNRPLPPEIVSNIRLRKALLNSKKKASSEIARRVINKQYNRVNHVVQQQIREFEDQKAEKLATDICSCNNSTQMWRLYNRYKNKSKPMEEPETPLITPDGQITANDKEKSDEFARHLRTVHQTPYSSIFDDNLRAEIDNQIENLSIEKSDICKMKRICIPQFRSLLQSTKANLAPGED